MSKVRGKTESIEEFLSRGGIITKIPRNESVRRAEIVKKTSAAGPATFLSLDEADLFFGEPSKNKKPKKEKSPSSRIDINALPPALRAKFIAKLKEEIDGEGYEEELEEIEDFDE